MRVLQDLGNPSVCEIEAVVITGDGSGEFRRLQTLAEHFGAGEVLWFPQRSERYLGRNVGIDVPGLEALRILELYKTKYQLYDFLYLVDSEHITDDPQEALESKLEEECPKTMFR